MSSVPDTARAPARIVLLALLVAVACNCLAASVPAWAGEAPTAPAASPTTEPTAEPTGAGGVPIVSGVLRDEDEPVEGVQLVARRVDGEEVGEATSDEEGRWEIELPGPGRYEVELLLDTLPEGTTLRNEERNPLSVTILGAGGGRTLIFALGEGTAGGGDFGLFLNTVADGIKFGLIIAMTAIGLSLVFGTTGLINFAHGELVTFGAVVAWYWNTSGGLLDVHLIIAAIAAIVVTAALAGGLELALFRPLRKRRVGLFQVLIITIGLSLAIRHIILMFYGGGVHPYTDYTISPASIDLGPVSLSPRDVTIMGLSVLILVAVGTMLQRTKVGKAMRAVSDNRDLAESSGIDVQRVILVVWVVGGALAAMGGVFYGSLITVDWQMGFQLLLLMFAGVILGGLGTAYGAMVGSLVVGLVTEVSTVWFSSELKFMWALLVLIIVLLFRPQGILGRRERVG